MFGNLLIITLVVYSKTLQSPMYFFLTQLSTSDILLSSDIMPILLYILLNNSGTVYFSSCMLQFYFFVLAEIYECIILSVMSYDRYMAICYPLRYSSMMDHDFCTRLVVLSWWLSICVSLLLLVTVRNLCFCGPNVINHFFCDMGPLLDLSCSDTSIIHIELIVLCVPLLLSPFIFILTSYYYIVCNILRIASTTGRQKAFSTCSSHLMVVSMFYGTLFFSYVLPTRGQSWNLSKITSLLYTVVIPLMNPTIYSLRNKDIKAALQKSVLGFQSVFNRDYFG